MVLAAPMLIAALLMGAMDRTVQTAFYIAGQGGSAYLFQNLFWVFGHPEVYVLALPGFGIVLELMPVFARKPLWGYRLAVAGMLGVAFLSFFVWQHHLFVSGINADLRPFYMLSTELISLPTGFIFLCAMGTLWRGRIRFTVPMLFCLAWVFNFLWGGISGVFNSDVPSDVTTHGSFFVMAHFHYTIMGGLIFAFFAGIYYWVPKMYGFKLNETLGKIHFWMMFIAFNSTFAPLFALGFLGMPRRVVTYTADLQGLNDWVSVSAYVLGLSMLVFLFNVVWSLVIKREPAEANPWHAKSHRVAAADAGAGARLRADPGVRPGPVSVRRAGAGRERRRWRPPEGARKPWKPPLRTRRSHRARAARVAAPRDLGRRAAAVRRDLVLLRLVRVRLLLPATRSTSTTTGRSAPCTRRGASGVAIMALFLVGAVIYRLAARRPDATCWRRGSSRSCWRSWRWGCSSSSTRRSTSAPPSGGYAAVFFGWTATYAIVALLGIYWIETQIASLWRVRREGETRETEVPAERGGAAPGRDRGLLVLLGVLRRDRRARLRRPLPRRTMNLGRLVAGPVADLRRARGGAVLLGSRGPWCGRKPLRGARVLRGLLTIVIALDSPIDYYADQLFWVHMLQHILLLTVAPPLILLGRPWPRMWRALPLGTADDGRADVARARWTAPLRALARPLPALILFNATIVGLAHPRRLRPTLTIGAMHELRARDVLLHRAAVLGSRDRSRAAAPAAGLAGADRLRGRRDGRGLGAGDHAGHRARTRSTATTRRFTPGPAGSAR